MQDDGGEKAQETTAGHSDPKPNDVNTQYIQESFHIGRSQSDSQLDHRNRAAMSTISQPVVPFQHNHAAVAHVIPNDMYDVDCSLLPSARTYPQDDCINMSDNQMPGTESSRARYNFQAGLLLTAEVVSDMNSHPS
jgi:hypothetical protein